MIAPGLRRDPRTGITSCVLCHSELCVGGLRCPDARRCNACGEARHEDADQCSCGAVECGECGEDFEQFVDVDGAWWCVGCAEAGRRVA